MIKTVVSISLGSSSRDMSVHADFNGKFFNIQRIGMNGNLARFREAIGKYSGEADVVTFGGIDIYLSLIDRRYIFRDAAKLLKAADSIPIVDGENFKRWVEPYFFRKIFDKGILPSNARILFPLAANRLALVQSMMEAGYRKFVFGDLIYDVGFPPIPLRSLEAYQLCGRLAGPLITRLPFSWIYPVGEKQHSQKLKRPDLFEEADIIAGDFHNIYRYMPSNLKNKIIITNTITQREAEILKQRNLKYLVTFSRNQEGRTFGSNVMDGIVTAYLNKDSSKINETEYLYAVEQLGMEPEIRQFDL